MNCFARGAKCVVLGGLAVVGAGAVVMLLWNGLLPDILSLKTITFYQALGLLVLSRILFGGFKGRCGCGSKRRMLERLEGMSPEEREKFKAGLKSRCCGGTYEADEPAEEKPKQA